MGKRIERAAESAGRAPHDITLVAVTKSVPVDRICEAIELGISHFEKTECRKRNGRLPRSDQAMRLGIS